MTCGTAHGKVILLGEHAVVYGVPALAVGIDRGAWADAAAAEGNASVSSLHVHGWNITVTDDVDDEGLPLARALRDILRATRTAQRTSGISPVGPMMVHAGADLPPGGGLGCSAAIGVAIARALDPAASDAAITERVDAWERVFHGNPSGIDMAVSVLGGCIHFERALAAHESRPTIRRVHLPRPLLLCIGHSGIASSTKTMVEAVARLRDYHPGATQRAFDAICTFVASARLALEAGDVRAIGTLLDRNQRILRDLSVSTPDIERMCETARTAGACGAKLTGAGGGGSVVAIVEDVARGEAVLENWKRDGFDGFLARVGASAGKDVSLSAVVQESA
ncbi:MAG: mevalonate kinase [Polyangiaceae bacterium]|nr:mevalonate kinase [Polyangiaceae bacterium]